MKVLLINGSPNEKGCTYTALSEVAKALHECGVETEIVHVGKGTYHTCAGCWSCSKTGRCVYNDDGINELVAKADAADGLVFGSPVHFASATGAITTVLDRLYAAGRNLMYKPGASVVSCRRAGSTAALDQLNKYFTISDSPLVGSQYWCMVHGNTPDEVRQDLEGMQIMRTLGRNLAWLLQCIEAGRKAGVTPPGEEEPHATTNFIR